MIPQLRSIITILYLLLFPNQLVQNRIIDISGSVYNASNEPIPENVSVTLHVLNENKHVFQQSAILDDEAQFIFENITFNADWVYYVSIPYDGVIFTSQMIQGRDISEGEHVNLQVTIYGSTTSDVNLLAERVHVFMNFSQPGTLRITELYTIINSGDHVIIPEDEKTSKLQFMLPTGAINLQIQSENSQFRTSITEYGFMEFANIYPLPAQYQILFRYDLPYQNEKTIRFIMPMNIKTAVLAIPQKDIELYSDRLVLAGTRVLEGEPMQLYMVNQLQKGEVIPIFVSGQPGNQNGLGEPSTQHLIISIVFFIPISILFIFWLVNNHTKLRKKRQRINDLDYEKQTILDEIVALDDLFRSNQLAIDAYKNRRNELLIVLKELMNVGD